MSTIGSTHNGRLEHLDMLRGLAAFLVLAGHLRAFVFVNYASLADTSFVTKAFYAATSLGHQAVIVFFALSGFLVGGQAIQAMTDDRWSWARYLLRRIVRLWIVIVPALVVTFIFDRIGVSLSGSMGYDGALYDIYVSGPAANDGIDLSLGTFVGNLAFLQTIVVPVFGTNSPIWSLANEFWYYVFFPLLLSIFLVRMHALQRIGSIVLVLILLAALPNALLMSGLIWLAGAFMARAQTSTLFRDNFVRAAVLAAVVMTLYLTKQPDADPSAEILFGIAVAVALPVLAQLPSFGYTYRQGARAGAEISYTLYLTHFPLLALIVFAGFAPYRFPPSLVGAIVYTGLLVLALGWAAIFWWCFERHTDRFHGVLSKALPGRVTR